MRLYYWAACAACLALFAVGCHESPIGDDFADKHYGAQGAIAIPSDVLNGFYDLADPDNAVIGFDLETKGEPVSSVDITATLTGGAQTLYQTVTTLPDSIAIPLGDLLSALGVSVDDVAVGDEVLFTFDCNSTTGKYRSNESLVVPFSCRSDLSGKMDYTTTNYFCSSADLTGEVVMNETAAGKYSFDDWSFGTYPECYGGAAGSWGSLSFDDVCNTVSISGVDNYGDSWSFDIEDISGSSMTFSWSNTYGEFGTTTLTRQDGNAWPPLTD